MPFMYNGHPIMHNPIPNPNAIVGRHPHLGLVPPPPPPMRHQPQFVANQRQLARQAQPAPNTRARAAVNERQLQAQQRVQIQRRLIAIEQARLAQVRLAEAENRARHIVRDQRAAVRMEQQERARLAIELERQRQRQPQMLPHPQVPMRLQGPAQPQAQGQAHQELYHHHNHHHQLPPPPHQQPLHNFHNPFALAYPAGIQPQHQPVMAPPPQMAENPHLKGRRRRRR